MTTKHFLICALTVIIHVVISLGPQAADFDWTTTNGAVNSDMISFSQSVDGVSVSVNAYVAERESVTFQPQGPFFIGPSFPQSGLYRDGLGLGLYATPASTNAAIAGIEACCGLFRPGFNAGPYLDDNILQPGFGPDIEALNFAVFEFSEPVNIESITLTQGAPNQNRSAWLAGGLTEPNLSLPLADIISAYAVVNITDNQPNNLAWTTQFCGELAQVRHLIVGAPPFGTLPGVTGSVEDGQFNIGGFSVSAAPSDVDGDTLCDAIDNCTNSSNMNQRDTDGDGIGNVCDADLNNDCIVNTVDLGLLRSVFFQGDADADFNGDGTVNVLDLAVLKLLFFAPPGPSGIANICD